MEDVAGAVEDDQPRAGDLARERLAVSDREERVGGAVDDERRDGDRWEAVAPRRAPVDEGVVLRARPGARAGDVALDQRPDARLVERALAPERPDVGDDVLDDRARVGPVDVGAGKERGIGVGDRREVAARARRRRAQQHERSGAVRVVEDERLRERATHRRAAHVGARDPVAVEDARGVGDEVRAAVVRPARRAGGRAAGVAVVVAHDEAPARRERRTERIVPPQHRRAHAHDQQHRRVAGVAERLGAQLDPIPLDDPLAHVGADPHDGRNSSPRVLSFASMLLSKRTVTTPDGRRVEVSVDWTRRPVRLPHAYRRRNWRKDAQDSLTGLDVPGGGGGHHGGGGGGGLDGVGADCAVAIAALIALVIAGLLVWFVIWPLLAIATELAVVATIAAAGLVGRVFFGRPWVIEAVDAGGERRWQVRGMAAARRTIDEIADQLGAGMDPHPGEAEPVGLPAGGAGVSPHASGQTASYE